MYNIIKFQAWADFNVNFLYHERGPFVEEQENGAGAKSRVCVLLKKSVNVNRSTVQMRIARTWTRIHSLIC